MGTTRKILKACFSQAAMITVASALSIGGLVWYDVRHGTLGFTLASIAIATDQPIGLSALDALNVPVAQRRDFLLMKAAESGSDRTIYWLVANGADLHYKHDRPLVAAAQFGHLSTVEYILDQGADIHVGSDLALYVAAINGREPMVDLLLERGAEPDNIKDRWCPRYLRSIPPVSEGVIEKLGPNLCHSYQP